MKKFRFIWHIGNTMFVDLIEGANKKICIKLFKLKHSVLIENCIIKNVTNEVCAYSIAC